jgi:hypothetical protein
MTELLAQSFNLIVCETKVNDPCTYAHLILLAKNLINALIIISTFIATAGFAYAGFTLLISGGSASAKTKAKNIFQMVGIGYLWILAAWLVVYTITTVLLNPGFSILGSPR